MTSFLCAFVRVLYRPLIQNASRRIAGFLAVGLLIGLNAFPASAHDYKIGDLAIAHPWSRATPEGANVATGYLVINNTGATPDRLVSVTSDVSGMAEIHEMAVDDKGVMTMRPLGQGIEIPAGGEVALKPGSFHIMFMNLKRPAKEGEKFAGSLTFEKAGKVDVEFAVEAMGGDDGKHDSHTN